MPVQNRDAPTGQRPLFVATELPGMVEVHPDDVAKCQTILDSVHLCLNYDPVRCRSYGFYADHLDLDRSHFSRMLKGTAAFSADAIEALQRICRNTAINDFLNRRFGRDSVPHNETEVERLRRENAALRAGGK